jgi:signal transduction histidine kinase
VKDYPLAIRHKSGKITHVLYNATVYKNEKGEIQGVFAAARDVTELKKAEEMARESARKLKDAERLATIGATAGMVGHDIRNPLQAIEGDVYLAKSDLALLPEGEGKENIKESLANIEKSVGYINKIVQDLQDFARPVKPKAQEMNLEELCETLFKDDIPEDVNVCCQVEKEAKKIIADPAILARILNNLISNAIQAMPQGGNLTIHACQDASDVIITVQDTGVGIAEDVKPKLFMPLFTTKSKGQGFGLPVVKRMTEALNGTVTFESEEGKGTKFILHLSQKK